MMMMVLVTMASKSLTRKPSICYDSLRGGMLLLEIISGGPHDEEGEVEHVQS